MENLNPTKNPKTTIPGYIFIGIATIMFSIQYILPAFIELKQEPSYPWWTPYALLAIGVTFLFLTDAYFERIFNRADKIAAKRTETDDQK